MKSSEFKKILKPLIKQTIKEVILEEGILSSIVSEVARGLQGNLVVESSGERLKDLEREEEHEKRRQEKIRKLNESGRINTNIFSGTQAMPEHNSASGPLTGVSASDAGIDITNIEKLANGKWKRLI